MKPGVLDSDRWPVSRVLGNAMCFFDAMGTVLSAFFSLGKPLCAEKAAVEPETGVAAHKQTHIRRAAVVPFWPEQNFFRFVAKSETIACYVALHVQE